MRLCTPFARHGSVLLAVALLLSVGISGCSIRQMALRQVADVLAASGDTWASDPDPELVADATPFALKTIESMLAELPDHRGLRLAACRGFTQYSFAFVEGEAGEPRQQSFRRSQQRTERARRLYLRGRDHCLHVLDLEWPGLVATLQRDPGAALQEAARRDVPYLFWAGASWGAAIVADGGGDVGLLADLPAVRALLERALELDESYERGLIHQAMIPLAAGAGPFPGSVADARRHLDRALELTDGQAASALVVYAESVHLPRQERRAFVEALERALAVDSEAVPELRLANELAQRRARFLLTQTEELFLDTEPEAQP